MPLSSEELRPGVAVRGTVLPGPVGLPVAHPMGAGARLTGACKSVGRVHRSVLSLPQHALLEATPENEPFDSEAPRRGLGAASVRRKQWAS